jgi:aryl-alcohol dehydrogenase-like predicted oxidoreductase
MEHRSFGRTGLQVSALAFGCGNVGGLMIRGAPAERERAVARAIELGIDYFDTAPAYGDGQSEINLGAALRGRRGQVRVGTKFRLSRPDLADVAGAIGRSLELSLRRLGMEHVDLLHLHNVIGSGVIEGGPIGGESGEDRVSAAEGLERVIPALERLREQGKTRFYGITALGDTEALHRVVEKGSLHSAQVCYNLLNPSAGVAIPPGFPAQDFRGLLGLAGAHGVGTIVIRVLAAGALSGVNARHPIAAPSVDPIASGPDSAADVRRAQELRSVLDEAGAETLVEAALRFAISHASVSTVLLGYSSLDHLETAATAVSKGPLPPRALERLASSST